MTVSVLLVILYRAFFCFARGAGKNSLINLFHIAQMSLYFLCGQQNNRLNGTFVVPTKFLCFPVSEIHREAELYVLQESAIWLLLLINVHLFYKAVKKFFLLQIGELII